MIIEVSPEPANLCMVRPEIGDVVVNRSRGPACSQWAIILLGMAILALGGCGRKGGLDRPDAAAPSAAVAQSEADAAREASKPSVFDPSYGSNAPAGAPKGRKKPFALDPLLGE